MTEETKETMVLVDAALQLVTGTYTVTSLHIVYLIITDNNI